MKKKYTKPVLLDELCRAYNELGRVPTAADMKNSNGFISYTHYYACFGSFNNALIEAGLKTNLVINYSEEFLLSELLRFYEENGRSPTTFDFGRDSGYPSCSPYFKKFGSWNAALALVNLDINSIKDYTNEFLLSELHRFVVEFNKVPFIDEMCPRNGYPSSASFIRRFGSWNNALIAAGLEPNITYHVPDGTEKCVKCGTTKSTYWRYDEDDNLLCIKCTRAERKYIQGKLNPNSRTGQGAICEYVVNNILENCINCNAESFNSKYDLISKTYGTINVKSSRIFKHKNRNSYYWSFRIPKSSEIPDIYICLALNNDRSEIQHVWIIPSDCVININGGIKITLGKIDKYVQYEVDATPYNKVYQELDIYTLPEFQNINHDNSISGELV